MQISYHTNNIPDQSPQIFNAARLIDHNVGRTTNFKASQEALLSHKSQNETYGNSKVFSPYLSPSSVVVSDKAIFQGSLEPLYMHNIAKTKYYFVSKPAKPSDHYKVNILA